MGGRNALVLELQNARIRIESQCQFRHSDGGYMYSRRHLNSCGKCLLLEKILLTSNQCVFLFRFKGAMHNGQELLGDYSKV